MARQVVQHLLQRIGAFRIGLAEHGLAARLMPIRVEGVARVGALQADAPAGQHACERGHVGLVVATLDAERVQLQHLTRQVFVQAGDACGLAVARGAPRGAGDDARVRSGRQAVVEVTQHRRVCGRCDQQRFERAGDVRPDRIALERTDQPTCAALGERDGEVIGPEELQPFGKRPAGRHRGEKTRACVRQADLAVVAGQHLLGGHAGWRVLG